MKKFIIALLMLFSIATIGIASEGRPGFKVGTIINIEYHAASKSVKEVKEWVGHNLVTKRIIESNDDEYIVTVKFSDEDIEDFYYDVEDFSLQVGQQIEIDEDE